MIFNNLEEIEQLANELLDKTFTVQPSGYMKTTTSASDIGFHFQWDNAKRRFGVCKHSRKIIGLSKPLCEINLDKKAKITDTILHEIAHAIARHMGGRDIKSHGRLWKEIAHSIGCKGERCYDGSKVNKPSSKYTLTCPTCEREISAHRKSRGSSSCYKCSTNGYDPQHKLILTQNY